MAQVDLINYIPDILKAVREVQALCLAEDPDIEKTWNAYYGVFDDQFANDLTENGAKRWEQMLKISPKSTDSLETRRFRILARLNEQLPYTMTTLRNQLDLLCGSEGYRLELDNENYIISVRVELNAKGKYDEVEMTLRKQVPANMFIDLQVLYNTWYRVKQKKWSDLKTKTWYGIRNEVI